MSKVRVDKVQQRIKANGLVVVQKLKGGEVLIPSSFKPAVESRLAQQIPVFSADTGARLGTMTAMNLVWSAEAH